MLYIIDVIYSIGQLMSGDTVVNLYIWIHKYTINIYQINKTAYKMANIKC